MEIKVYTLHREGVDDAKLELAKAISVQGYDIRRTWLVSEPRDTDDSIMVLFEGKFRGDMDLQIKPDTDDTLYTAWFTTHKDCIPNITQGW